MMLADEPDSFRAAPVAPAVQVGSPMWGLNAARRAAGAVEPSGPGSPARVAPGTSAPPQEMGVASDELVVSIEAVFDIAAALRARDALVRLPSGASVCVDLSRVGESHDAAFAVLADGIARLEGVSVRFRGLTDRQSRMLRYFGIGSRDREL